MKNLRVAAYVFAVAAIAMTALLTAASGDDGIVVALLGGTLAVTPYVLVRAFEESLRESIPSFLREIPLLRLSDLGQSTITVSKEIP